jgi:hypothetical protein
MGSKAFDPFNAKCARGAKDANADRNSHVVRQKRGGVRGLDIETRFEDPRDLVSRVSEVSG